MRKSQIIFVLIAALCANNIKPEPVLADSITSPACKDVPSCIVAGTVVIGGVVYYVIKNTVTGVIHRVPVGSVQRMHINNEGREQPPRSVVEMPGAVVSEEQCRDFARKQQEKYGGIWEPVITHIAGSSPGTEDIPSFTTI
ncbi:MAG: hypothetical protein PUP92_33615 [Rhizonema sp. PD38]|nr:hypothetical protein [Rhizonema sp. PD38]